MEYIINQVDESSYGSTQATILALKAITIYMKEAITINGSGSFILQINFEEAQEVAFTSKTKNTIEFDLTEFIETRGK